MFFPSEREILMYELFEGRLLKRLRPPGTLTAGAMSDGKIKQKQRIADLAWRPFNAELYSAHGNGTIRAWKPRTREDVLQDEAPFISFSQQVLKVKVKCLGSVTYFEPLSMLSCHAQACACANMRQL